MFSNRILRFALVVLSLLVSASSLAASVAPSIIYLGYLTGQTTCALRCSAHAADAGWPQPSVCTSFNTDAQNVCTYLITANAVQYSRGPVTPTYSCATGYTFNASTVMCDPDAVLCPAVDTLHSNGYFNVGLSPSGTLLNTACIASCGLYLHTGYSPAASSLINGVRYYFGSGEYRHTGQSCSPDTPNFLADFVGQLPAGTCAPGQSFITMNGVTKCINSGTGVDVNAASAAAAAKTLLDQRAAEAAQAARDAAAAAGGTASEVAAAGIQAAADTASADASVLNSSDPETAAFCKDNPTASICASQEFGEVADADLQEKTINVSITPFAVGGAGYCPAPSPLLNKQGKQYYFEWTTYCNYATGIKPIILAFAWLAAAGILVGGFRSA